tara:strand:+ start:234 stop:335 length:102 start_codon:yes stop_codon:yes gene_type:complete
MPVEKLEGEGSFQVGGILVYLSDKNLVKFDKPF